MTEEDIRGYISSVKWQFAKSMPEIPHEYTVKDWDPHKMETFNDFVRYIRKYGEDGSFYGRKFTYLVLDEFKYWTMGDPISETTLINRIKK